MSNQTLSDHQIWELILKDDPAAFAILYERYWLRLYKTATHYINDTSACEEIVHDVFMIIWNKRYSLKIDHFVNYLNAITRYEVYRHMKIRKLSIVEYNSEYAQENVSGIVFNLGQEKLDELDLEHNLNDYLQKLPKRCRQIFYMSKIQQLSNNEIASQLHINKHTVENQLTYALKCLKVSIKKLSVFIALFYLIR